MSAGFAIFALLIFMYAAVALWLGRWSITMPMVFVVVGFTLGPGVTNVLPIAPDTEWVKALTELTLALLLFSDASTLSLKRVRMDAALPARLLVVMVLTIGLGALAMLGLFPAEGVAFAALIGAILAPTDAALGLAIFTNPKVPVRVRRALNVESGLNDGVAAPFVMLFVAFATATQEIETGHWFFEALTEIALAIVAGAGVGVIGGWVLTKTARHGWTSQNTEQMAILGLAGTAYFTSVAIHGNGFIAAFVAGIVFGSTTHERFHEPTEFTETFSTFLSLIVWGIFGAVLVNTALGYTTDLRPIFYAVISLTVVRIVPVAIALIGTHLRTDTVLLMGWFGPRGLASVVFTLLAFTRFESAGKPDEVLLSVTVWTILLSVLAHGLSAKPLANWYARRLATATGEPAELVDMPELRPRSVSRLSPTEKQSPGTVPIVR